MPQYFLVIVDTTGIQEYVFGTNNLRQITGASYLVDCVTRLWVKEALTGLRHNVLNLEDLDHPVTPDRIEDGKLDAELIYAGGGNTVLIFVRQEHARQYVSNITYRAMQKAPGLQTVVHIHPFLWDERLGGKNGVMQVAFQELAQKKARGQGVPPVLGYSVTAECIYTNLPAVGVDDKRRLISAESKAKLACENDARRQLLKSVDFHGFTNPSTDFDQLGATPGEKSALAVVHIDGNGMGKRVEAIQMEYADAAQNREYINEQRKFSFSIQKASTSALQSVINKIIAAVDPKTNLIGGQVRVQNQQLPFRPIVFGGDDITFVCDGRIGLSVAAYYLQALEHQMLSDDKPLECRAGVAIVRSHYPFARAYEMAESLCKSAKSMINDVKKNIQKINEKANIDVDVKVTAIDWHYATSGIAYDLNELRRREYHVPTGTMLSRPLYVTCQIEAKNGSNAIAEFHDQWRSWDGFVDMVSFFRDDEAWRDKHNKVKALRQALRGGPDVVKMFAVNYQAKWPKTGFTEGESKEGWKGPNCIYFDPIETVDLFISI